MDPNDWYAAEILMKQRLGDLRRTVESLRSPDGRPRPSLRVVVRTTLAASPSGCYGPKAGPRFQSRTVWNRPPCLSDLSLRACPRRPARRSGRSKG